MNVEAVYISWINVEQMKMCSKANKNVDMITKKSK